MLTLQHITSSYGLFPVLLDVSINVDAGEIRVILGPNGAGKSTLLKSIMGLVPKVTGTLRGPGDTDLIGLKTNKIANMGVAYVPEGGGILNSLTVLENLQVGAIAAQDRSKQGFQARLDHVMTLFPFINEKLGQPAGLLSGGQLQMLAIGRALMPNPKVLLLDEPSLGLAPFVRTEIAELLLQIVTESSLAIILVEQDVGLAERCGSNFQVLRRGRLGESFGAKEIKDRERLSRLYLGIDTDRKGA